MSDRIICYLASSKLWNGVENLQSGPQFDLQDVDDVALIKQQEGFAVYLLFGENFRLVGATYQTNVICDVIDIPSHDSLAFAGYCRVIVVIHRIFELSQKG